VYLVVEALNNGKNSPEEISSFLKSLNNYQGVSNIISFNEDGRVVQKKHIIKEVKDGEFVVLE